MSFVDVAALPVLGDVGRVIRDTEYSTAQMNCLLLVNVTACVMFLRMSGVND